MSQPLSVRPAEPGAGYVVLVPVHDDWDALERLLPALDESLGAAGLEAAVILVDDASSEPPPPALLAARRRSLTRLQLLPLRRNLGHQRAIAVGLSWIASRRPCRAVVVMDGDGEDRPEDVVRLVRRHEESGGRVIFAERTRRSESLLFRVFYRLYCLGHRVLAGHRVRVGNFSLVPFSCLERLTAMSELWNHYAAAVFRSKLPRETIPTERGRRLAGASRMNFVSLVVHGLSALSVFSDVIGVRLLMASLAAISCFLAGIAAVAGIRFATDLAIPGWATTAAGFMAVLLFNATILALAFCFFILAGRQSSTFLPSRDALVFVKEDATRTS